MELGNLTRDLIIEMVHEGCYRKLQEVVFRFLSTRFGMEGPAYISEMRDHLSGFAGEVLGKWEEKRTWQFVLDRCDTTEAVQAYLVKSFQNYASKQRRIVDGEPLAQRNRIRRILQRSEPFTHDTYKVSKKKLTFYGLKCWEGTHKHKLFLGNFQPSQQLDKFCLKTPPFSRNKRGKYRGEDLIKGCRLFLEAIEENTRAYVISDAVGHYWAPCVNFNLSSFIDLDDKQHEDLDAPLSSFEEDLYFMLEEMLGQLTAQQRFVLEQYTLPCFSETPVTLESVAKKMGCSHGTVHNRHNEVLASLKDIMSESSTEERLHFCSFLPKFLENTKNDSLCHEKHSRKGEV